MNLTNPIYQDPDKAREHLEKIQWPHGPFCPHCGNADPKRVIKLKGKSTRPGVYKCNECRKPFSVTVGTVFERSHIPLNKWLLAVHLLTASKKGMSSHQLHRTLGVTYKTAWFMAHRIREAMRPPNREPMGGEGQTVEVDETYFGNLPDVPKSKGYAHKNVVMGLVNRDTGEVRTFHIASTTINQTMPIVLANIRKESTVYTDEASHYRSLGQHFAKHDSVVHSREEYARGPVSTNQIEGFFSIFKRGMRGIYQHCAEHHLHRYLAEFDFRYSHRIALGSNDTIRMEKALVGIYGKRLTYRRPDEAGHS